MVATAETGERRGATEGAQAPESAGAQATAAPPAGSLAGASAGGSTRAGRARWGLLRGLLAALVGLVCAALLVGAGWWAGRTALEPPADPLAAPAPVSIEVAAGEVGRTLPLSALAQWETAATVQAPAGGVITAVPVESSGRVREGAPLVTVNLAPAFAAVGSTPVFRTMAPGDSGADVRQLEAFLARSGFDPGLRDGFYSGATVAAVRAWQEASGAAVTGTVELGSLVFVPRLPARVRPLVAVGDTVAGGQPLAEVVGKTPVFTVAITDEQVSLIPPRARVRVGGPEGVWPARAAGVEMTEEGTRALRLRGTKGRPVCKSACSKVPVAQESQWPAAVVIVRRVTGAVVPVGAVRTGPDGARFVVSDSGVEVPVKVRASSDGQAVVKGVEVGSRVLLPAAAAQ